jgi:glyoxylase-like metal-dependent hydrolase (beta-lactamase superfamily II)
MPSWEIYKLYAIRYAWREGTRAQNFLMGDPHDGPMPLDYFVWAAVSDRRTVVIDTGFTRESAERRGRFYLRAPIEGLKLLGIAAEDVRDVIVTHLHWDHAGTLAHFPNARFHLQDTEMEFATGRHMGQELMRFAYDVEDVVEMVRAVYRSRVAFHAGVEEIAPNLFVHRIGGHTNGLQCVRAWTERGWVVLASDATHFYANMMEGRPFPIVFNVGDMLQGFDTLRRLASSPDHVIPGHDPLVMRLYPPPAPELEGIVARLDVEPRALDG